MRLTIIKIEKYIGAREAENLGTSTSIIDVDIGADNPDINISMTDANRRVDNSSIGTGIADADKGVNDPCTSIGTNKVNIDKKADNNNHNTYIYNGIIILNFAK